MNCPGGEEGSIGIVGALRRELADLRRRMQVENHRSFGNQQIWEGMCRGRRVILMQSGMGRPQAEKTVEYLLERYSLSTLLCIGFGGGVSRELRAGDIVVCPSVYRAGERLSPKEWTLEERVRSDERLMSSAVEALVEEGVRFHVGDGLTVSQMVAEPGLKERMGKVLSVKVVDMESFWIGQRVLKRGIPLLVARAISDPVDQTLSHVEKLLNAAGETQIERIARHLLRHPFQAPTLLRLARSARQAGRSLGAFVPALIGRLECTAP